jgi:hypothetical protein
VYTAPYAAWHTPVFLLNSRLGRFSATRPSYGAKPSPNLASLLPKLRDQYAEFLDPVSLVHLRLLASPTCVGLRYGHLSAPSQAFLARRLHKTRASAEASALAFPSRLTPTRLDGHPQSRSCFVPVSLATSSLTDGAGISTG